MKKILIIMLALATICAGAYAEKKKAEAAADPNAPIAGIQPLMVQAAFYTPTYQCIYMKGTDELDPNYKPNAWCAYAAPIAKKTVTYDGMGGKFQNINVIRIKSNTKKMAEEVAIYIDNVVVKDPSGKAILTLDFENGDPAGVYVSMGKPLAGNGTVVEKDGKKCFLMHMKSENMYGYNGLEVQWALPPMSADVPTWDFSKENYSVSFDYLMAVK
jgi:hypothetical protein